MPVLTVAVGRSATGKRLAGARAAKAATPLVTRQALFEQAGIIAAANLGELLDTAALLAAQPVPAGGRVGMVSNTRGAAVLAADACSDAGLLVASLTGDTQRALRDLLPREAIVAGPVDVGGGQAGGPALLVGRTAAAVVDEAVTEHLVDGVIDSLVALFEHRHQVLAGRGSRRLLLCVHGRLRQPHPDPVRVGHQVGIGTRSSNRVQIWISGARLGAGVSSWQGWPCRSGTAGPVSSLRRPPTDPCQDIAKYVIAVEVPSHAQHSQHDADPGFQEFNRLADAFQPEAPLVYGGQVLHAA